MPSMPPPPCPPGIGASFFSGISATRASVVSINDAIEPALVSAVRTTLVGSSTPALTRSSYSLFRALKPKLLSFESLILPITMAPSSPAFTAIWRNGSVMARFTMLTPICSSPSSFSLSRAATQRARATPPPGTIPSSTAARVACMASSTRAFVSFISVSVAAPTLITATPPTSFANRSCNISRLAFALDNCRVVFVDGDFLGLSEIGQGHVLQLDPQIFRDGLAAGQSCDVLQHGLAAVAEARSLDGRDLQRATQFVDDQSRQRFAFHVLSDDQQRLAALSDLLQQRQQVFHRADFLLVDQDVSVLLHRLHALRISDEVRRQIAAVELHALDHIQLRFQRLRLFHRDDAILADFLHGFGNDLANRLVVVRRDRAHLGNHLAGDGLGEFVEFAFLAVAFLVESAGDEQDCLLDAALHGHRIGASSHGLHALAIDCLGQNGSGGGAVAGYVRGLRSNFADHLGAHVLEVVFQFNFLGYGDAIFGDGRRTEFLFNDNVAALGAKSDLHSVSQQVDAAENGLSRLFSVNNLLCHSVSLLMCFSAGSACELKLRSQVSGLRSQGLTDN